MSKLKVMWGMFIGVAFLYASNNADVVKRTPLTKSSPKAKKVILFEQGTKGGGQILGDSLLFDQSATGYYAFYACQWDSVYPFWARIADNFTVPYPATVDSLVWWGGYWNGTPTPPLDFWIEIYEDSSGMPKQNPVYQERVSFTETNLGQYYKYEASIPPFNAQPGVTYWITFMPTLVYPPQWGNNGSWPGNTPGWGDGQESYFKSDYFGYPTWTNATTVFGNPIETSFQIYGMPLSDSVVWDFETGWQGWTHTNGQAFPWGWDVQPADLHSDAMSPSPGDSSMWIDSDATGSGGVADTALSPLLIPTPNTQWLKWGCGYQNYAGYDTFYVGIKVYDGTSWQTHILQKYYTDIGADVWDSADISGLVSGAQFFQIFFYYNDYGHWAWYASFDNVSVNAIIFTPAHDVGVAAITSPPEGPVSPGDYDVIAQIHNYGNSTETFDITAVVYDTVGWVPVFTNTLTLTDFPAGADTLLNFGTVTFENNKFYFTQVYTQLSGDENPSNDTLGIYSRTALALGDVVFELDVQTPTGDYQCLGVEFDGTYFYVTGGGAGSDPNKVYVIDTLGNLIWSLDQPAHSTGWGWRDIAWDGVYAGPDRIDTLYASVNNNVDKFGIDLTTGTLNYYGSYPGPEDPNRALAWMADSGWFFTANFSGPIYKFSKTNSNLGSVANSWSMYGAAWDSDILEGGWIWWHSQDDPGTGYAAQIEQFDPLTMSFTGVNFGYLPTQISSGVAGGLCFYEGFRGMDVLFALIQGDPVDEIVGIFVRWHMQDVAENNLPVKLRFGFAPTLPTIMKGENIPITYTILKPGKVTLRIYNETGKLVKTLANIKNHPAGKRTIYWNLKDGKVPNGIYFLTLDSEGKKATKKIILVR